jgi:hypothetical protein
MRWLPHFHRDPDWQSNGLFALYRCRCGAKRTRWINRGMYGPIPDGFPRLTDRHGQQLADSGWIRP